MISIRNAKALALHARIYSQSPMLSTIYALDNRTEHYYQHCVHSLDTPMKLLDRVASARFESTYSYTGRRPDHWQPYFFATITCTFCSPYRHDPQATFYMAPFN